MMFFIVAPSCLDGSGTLDGVPGPQRTRRLAGPAIGHQYRSGMAPAVTGCTHAPARPWRRAASVRPCGRQVVRAAAWSRRIPSAIVTMSPTPMSTSPMVKTFASGMPAGIAKMSVSGASAGSATTTLFEKPVSLASPAVRDARPGRRHHRRRWPRSRRGSRSPRRRRWRGPGPATLRRPRRGPPPSRRRRSPRRRSPCDRPTGVENRTTWTARPAIGEPRPMEAQLGEPLEAAADRAEPTTTPIGMAIEDEHAVARRQSGGGPRGCRSSWAMWSSAWPMTNRSRMARPASRPSRGCSPIRSAFVFGSAWADAPARRAARHRRGRTARAAAAADRDR